MFHFHPTGITAKLWGDKEFIKKFTFEIVSLISISISYNNEEILHLVSKKGDRKSTTNSITEPAEDWGGHEEERENTFFFLSRREIIHSIKGTDVYMQSWLGFK